MTPAQFKALSEADQVGTVLTGIEGVLCQRLEEICLLTTRLCEDAERHETTEFTETDLLLIRGVMTHFTNWAAHTMYLDQAGMMTNEYGSDEGD